jgi:hypothetical protein
MVFPRRKMLPALSICRIESTILFVTRYILRNTSAYHNWMAAGYADPPYNAGYLIDRSIGLHICLIESIDEAQYKLQAKRVAMQPV